MDHATGAEVALKIIVRLAGGWLQGRQPSGLGCLEPRPERHPYPHLHHPPTPLAPQRNKKRFQKQAAVEAAILALLREQVGLQCLR